MKFVGTLVAFLAVAGLASAAVLTPEIDGGSLSSGLALAAGALMVARGRRKR